MGQFDETVAHTIKHFELHRMGGVEWRVISDIEAGVISVTAVEETVLTRFMALPEWPHSVVTFFVLQDLAALQRQLASRRDAASANGSKMMLPSGGIAGLAQRPIVNLYDLADPSVCHIFVNQSAMQTAGYWGDVEAETALLAHEHAHPMVENATVRASRQLSAAVTLSSRTALSRTSNEQWLARLQDVTQSLVNRLCLYAPRELFTNALAIQVGFQSALCYLDRMTIERSALALPGRQALVTSLRAEGDLTDAGRRAFLILADLQAHLEMAFEVASFRREGVGTCAGELESLLRSKLFAKLTPDLGRAFASLTQLYAGLRDDLTPEQYRSVVDAILVVMADVLAPSGIVINQEISLIREREG